MFVPYEDPRTTWGITMPIAVRRAPAIAVAVAALCSGAALAEEAANGGLEEIVVTAQKRSEKLLDVPVAVTVVGEEQLQAQHVYTIADLARTAPSLEMVQAFGGPGGGGQIRGIGTNSFTRSAEGAVGIVIDGVPQGNVQGNNVYDIGQVEVLRGPQGTLFGLTSSAGVINMTTVAPDPSGFKANVHLDLSSKGLAGSKFGQQTLRGAVNVPLGDNSALRLSVNGDLLKGVQRNANNGEENYSHDAGFRLRYLWKSDTTTVNLIADYDHRTQNYGDPQFTYVNVAPGSPLANELAACGVVASWGNQDRCTQGVNNSDTTNTGLSAQADFDLGGATLTSITGWRKSEQNPSSVDIMGTPAEFTQIFTTGAVSAGRQFSQEVRISSPGGTRVEYTAGLFYSDYLASAGYAPGGSFNVGSYQLAPVFISFASDNSSTETTNKAWAGFGQATWHVTDRFGLIGGLRYTSQKLADQQVDGGVVVASGETSQSNVSGKAGLQYKFSPDLNSYATYTRGYKGPQIIPASQGNLATKVSAEIPNAYEIGLKGVAVGGRLNYDVSAFYTTVHDYQGQRCIINPVGVLSCLGQSIPSVTSRGVELELFGKPARGLWFNAGFIYDDAKFPTGWTGYDPDNLSGGTTSLGDLQLVGVPKEKFTLSGEYSHGLGGIEGYFGADAVYKSGIRFGYSGDPRFVYPSHWTLGARLGIRGQGNRWSAEFFARNLTDEHEPITLFGGPAFVPPGAIPFPPLSNGFVGGVSGWMTPASLRQVGLSVEARW
jgi:iron complex outermembrane receptor protein